MEMIVRKKENRNQVIYHITDPILCRTQIKRIPKMVEDKPFQISFIKGIESLLNIPGPYTEIRLKTSSHDFRAISKDWQRVGQSLFDGSIAFDFNKR